MVKDAEANAVIDKEKSEQIELVNQSEALCYQTKKQLEQLENQISSEEKQKIENQVEELEIASKNDDYVRLKELMEQLKKSVMEVGEKVYSSGNVEDSANGAVEDVIDTDFSAEKK